VVCRVVPRRVTSAVLSSDTGRQASNTPSSLSTSASSQHPVLHGVLQSTPLQTASYRRQASLTSGRLANSQSARATTDVSQSGRVAARINKSDRVQQQQRQRLKRLAVEDTRSVSSERLVQTAPPAKQQFTMVLQGGSTVRVATPVLHAASPRASPPKQGGSVTTATTTTATPGVGLHQRVSPPKQGQTRTLAQIKAQMAERRQLLQQSQSPSPGQNVGQSSGGYGQQGLLGVNRVVGVHPVRAIVMTLAPRVQM
jgi:hypothetical protein